MIRAVLLAAASIAATPAAGQMSGHDMHDMPGMHMPAKPAAPSARPRARVPAKHADHADTPSAPDPMPMQHDVHAMPMPTAKLGTDLPAGNAPAPQPATDHLADRFYDPATMARSREDDLRREHGGRTYRQLLVNLAEYRSGDGYRWDAEAWVGGDIDRLWLKSEGTGTFGRPIEDADAQLLFGHAIDPYFDLQAGIRQGFGPGSGRTYATVGIEGLAPYQIEVEGQLFLSTRGDLLARAEAWHDARLTQFVVLQPRMEVQVAAQDVPENRIGSGLQTLELGLRLRYEKRRELAPYLGVSWQRSFGDTRRFARAAGEDTGGAAIVAGIRGWF